MDIGGINTAFGLVDRNGDLYAESVIFDQCGDYPAMSKTHQAMHYAAAFSFEYRLRVSVSVLMRNYHKGTVQPREPLEIPRGDPNPMKAAAFSRWRTTSELLQG